MSDTDQVMYTPISDKSESHLEVESKTPGRESFESAIWGSRLVVLVPVVASLLIAIAMFYVATVDTFNHLKDLRTYANPSPLPEVHDKLRGDLIAHVVEAIDGYLLGIVMLIFSMGLYELFINRILPAVGSERAKSILVVHSLDDLKSRLGQVILLMLVVKFFERALWITYETTTDLVVLSGGILLVSIALQLAHLRPHAATAPGLAK
jgi:uncharacterized membrane protein YqhA